MKLRTALSQMLIGAGNRLFPQAAGLVGTDQADENKYRRATSHGERDLAPMKYEQVQRLAFYEWQRYPLAKRMIQIITDFCTGEEFSVQVFVMKREEGEDMTTNREDAQTIWDEFYTDPVNNLSTGLSELVQDLFLNGELLLPVSVNEISGRVRIGYIDPLNVREVHTAPLDARRVERVTFSLDGGLAGGAETLNIINVNLDPASTTYNKLTGEAFYFQINKITSQKRGYSELMEVLDWIKGLETFLFDSMKGFSARNTFIWTQEHAGKTESELKNVDRTPPRIGSVAVHNEGVKWDVLSPDLKAMDVTEGVRLLKNFILGGKGFPEHWFADGGNTNLATAEAMTTPTMRMLKAKQDKVKKMFSQMARFVVDQAVIAGRLHLEPNEYIRVTVNTFDFERQDAAVIGSGFVQLVTAVTTALLNNLLPAETARQLIANYIQRYGVTVNAEDMRDLNNEPMNGGVNGVDDETYGGVEEIYKKYPAIGEILKKVEGN